MGTPLSFAPLGTNIDCVCRFERTNTVNLLAAEIALMTVDKQLYFSGICENLKS